MASTLTPHAILWLNRSGSFLAPPSSGASFLPAPVETARTAPGFLVLLARVRNHERRFFISSRDHYDTAAPGTVRFAPPVARIPKLRCDYAAMEPMFLSPPSPIDAAVATLHEAARTINKRSPIAGASGS